MLYCIKIVLIRTSHIQTEPLNGKDEIHNFIRVLMSKNLLKEVYIKNEMINDFINKN